jgi:hypothetical protein
MELIVVSRALYDEGNGNNISIKNDSLLSRPYQCATCWINAGMILRGRIDRKV